GTPPSHPELLDWLACDFEDSGWDVKRTLKQIVMSAAYRQDSRATPALLERDPQNRLMARGSRFRLQGEFIRDHALAVSGLLAGEVGGPGVKPPQPPGLWKAVGYVGSNTDRFVADQGPDKVFRRSIYTFWKRTAPPPQLSTFDAPSREECRVRRERTNTPLQALLLMNDPQYVEAARHLAQRTLRRGGASDRERAAWLFERATCRPAGDRDLRDMLGLLAAQRKEFAAHPDHAAALIAIGETPPAREVTPVELASWTLVANLVLNLDEVVTRG
ncbi:MAG: DUF1553 domain-containing protein, partial [Planctomycetes bacterium]|nr:DUF1553 domain-containing protein [Planctomycetota bacterium]